MFRPVQVMITAMTSMVICGSVLAAGLAAEARIVFLGDSITDGNTYPMLVEQALREAGRPVPRLFNAGVGGDTSAGMLKRLDRDVFRCRPTLVFVSAGINDQFLVEEYRNHITAILDVCQERGSGAAILTTSIVRSTDAKVQQKLDGYNQCLRELASQRGLALGDVNQLMTAVPDAANQLLVEDGIHPNYQGQRVIARAVLNALECRDVPVPEVLRIAAMPGIVPTWHMRAAAANEPALTPALATTLTPTTCARVVELPQRREGDTSQWNEQERERGFALELDKLIGTGERFFGAAVIHSDAAREAVLSTGGGLKAVVLNDALVYRNLEWTGWHAGKEQVRVALVRGENRLAIECGTSFFLSVTAPER